MLNAICILDGDANIKCNKYILKLPTQLSPEGVVFEYSRLLYKDNTISFWNKSSEKLGITIQNYVSKILPQLDNNDYNCVKGKATKKKRETSKKIYRENKLFFVLVMEEWLNDKNNQQEIEKFLYELRNCFLKVCDAHNIAKKEWPKLKNTDKI